MKKPFFVFLLTAVKFVVNSCLLQFDIINHITDTEVRGKVFLGGIGQGISRCFQEKSQGKNV